jgi:hypothetical protein
MSWFVGKAEQGIIGEVCKAIGVRLPESMSTPCETLLQWPSQKNRVKMLWRWRSFSTYDASVCTSLQFAHRT